MWISGGVLALAIASIGIVAATRQRPPQVAVATRSAAIMVQSLERAKEALATLRREGAPAPESDEGLIIEPDALPPAKPDPVVQAEPSSSSGGAPIPRAPRTPRPYQPPDRGPKPPKTPGVVDDPGF